MGLAKGRAHARRRIPICWGEEAEVGSVEEFVVIGTESKIEVEGERHWDRVELKQLRHKSIYSGILRALGGCDSLSAHCFSRCCEPRSDGSSSSFGLLLDARLGDRGGIRAGVCGRSFGMIALQTHVSFNPLKVEGV